MAQSLTKVTVGVNLSLLFRGQKVLKANDGLSTTCDTSECRQQTRATLGAESSMTSWLAKLPYTSLYTHAFHSVRVPCSFGFLRLRMHMRTIHGSVCAEGYAL